MYSKSLVITVAILCFSTMVMAEMMSTVFSGTEIRSKPNAMDSKVILKVAPHSPLLILGKGADYYQVKDHSGHSGWVHRSLLSQTRGVIVTSYNANIRQGPGPNHPVIFQLSKGMTAKFLAKQDKWIQLETADGKTGWIADFLVWGD